MYRLMKTTTQRPTPPHLGKWRAGLIAGFLFREPWYFAPFGAVSIGAMIAYAPRHALLDAVVRAARKA